MTPHDRIARLLADGTCVVLDGGVATEIQRIGGTSGPPDDEQLWGTWALYSAPDVVREVHRRYVEAGCDVVSTNTWSILSTPEFEARRASDGLTEHWMDVARLGVRLAREAADEGDCAVAFAISEEVDTPEREDTLELLGRVFETDPPDLILMETMSLIRDDFTFRTVETLLETGLPVWLGFRRCRHGVCGVYGQHWGPPEGDLFGRAARRFEQMGVEALLINCLPIDHVPGMLPWLRDFTDLPLGVYPNLGHLAGAEWRFEEQIGPGEYAELALDWRAEGAQIVGGCCGVGPEHLGAARGAVAGTEPGRGIDVSESATERLAPLIAHPTPVVDQAAEPWTDAEARRLFPLAFPSLTCDPGVFQPTDGSLLMWKYLFEHGLGAGKRCLDAGAGCGILTVQLALNGAERVHAVDIDKAAVANTLANAFRNDVADRVDGETVDLFAWEPEAAYEVVVASLYQTPVDPFAQPSGHRPLDYWGRSLLDHFLSLLPAALADDGVAYVLQLSILSQQRTEALVESLGLQARVAEFGFFPFGAHFEENRAQIDRVEQLSDAYHLTIGDRDLMLAYVLEVTRA